MTRWLIIVCLSTTLTTAGDVGDRACLAAAEALYQLGATSESLDWLGRVSESARGWEWSYLHNQLDQSLSRRNSGQGSVQDMAVDRHGWVTLGSDGRVQLWDLDGQPSKVAVAGHQGALAAVALSWDGRFIATAGRDKIARVWDRKTGKQVTEFSDMTYPLFAVTFSPDGTQLAASGYRRDESGYPVGHIKVWTIKDGSVAAELDHGHHPVSALLFSEDGERLYSGSWFFELKAWDTSNWSEALSMKPDRIPVNAAEDFARVNDMSLSPDGSKLASAHHDGVVRLWDVEDGRQIARLSGHMGPVLAVDWRPGGLVSGGLDQSIRLWDVSEKREIVRLRGHTGPLRAIGLLGARLISAADDGTIRTWALDEPGLYRRSVVAATSGLWGIAFSRTGDRVFSGSSDSLVRVHGTLRLNLLREWPSQAPSVNGILVTPDGKRLVTSGNDGHIRIWNAETLDVKRVVEGHQSGVTGLALSHDGKTVASASNDGSVKVWDLARGELLHSIEVTSTYGVDFSPDGLLIAAASRSGTIALVETQSGEVIAELKSRGDSCIGVAFSPDGKHLASCSGDHRVSIWDVERRVLVHSLSGHDDMVYAIAWLPDGSRLLSASYDQTLRFWDPVSGQSMMRLRGFDDGIYAIAVSRDGDRIALGQLNGTLTLLDRRSIGVRMAQANVELNVSPTIHRE